MKKRIRNIALSLMACAVVCGPGMLFAAQRIAHVELPRWITAEEGKFLSGSASDIDVRGMASLSGFVSGDFQTSLESEIGNFVPCKSTALLTNAAIQRSTIVASNAAFGWEWYPTFFGSDVVSDKGHDLLVTPIVNESDSVAYGLEETARVYSETAEAHPDVAFYVGMPTSGGFSMLLDNLGSSFVDDAYVREHFVNRLGGGINYVDLTVDDIDEYRELYFKTDHHWKMSGGYRAYQLIADSMGLADDILPMGEALPFDVEFYGSEARVGLDLATGPDDLVDYAFDLPAFDVYEGFERDEVKDPEDYVASSARYSAGLAPTVRFANHYGEYYHGDIALLELAAEEASEDGGALLIAGDSFTNNMERLFLHNFDKVYSYVMTGDKETLSEMIDQLGDVDAVLILQCFGNLAMWE